MRSKTKTSGTKNGAALLTVMGIAFAIFTVLGTVVFSSMQQMHMADRLGNRARAIAIAEAGVAKAYSVLVTNFEARANSSSFPSESYGGGRFDLSVLPVSSNVAIISCTGTYGNVSEWVVLDATRNYYGGSVTNAGWTDLPRVSPWAHTVFCNGFILRNGSGNVYGSVHANNYIQCNGSLSWGLATNSIYVSACGAQGFSVSGGATIFDTVEAPVINVTGPKSITEEIVGPVAPVPMPNISAFLTECYKIAVSNNQVFSGGTINAQTDWGTVPGGVRWINGSLTVNGGGGVTVEGAVIVTGNVTLRGGFNQTRVGYLPALVSRDCSITCNGSHSVNGLVYAKSDITWNGSGTLQGSLICGGNLRFNGSNQILNYTYSEPFLPGSGPGSGSSDDDYVYVNSWQR